MPVRAWSVCETYEQFVERCGANDIASDVKLADIADNSDLSRLRQVTPADLERIEKYRAAAARLADIASGGKPARR